MLSLCSMDNMKTGANLNGYNAISCLESMLSFLLSLHDCIFFTIRKWNCLNKFCQRLHLQIIYLIKGRGKADLSMIFFVQSNPPHSPTPPKGLFLELYSIVWFQKISIPTSRKVIENYEREGGIKSQNFYRKV